MILVVPFQLRYAMNLCNYYEYFLFVYFYAQIILWQCSTLNESYIYLHLSTTIQFFVHVILVPFLLTFLKALSLTQLLPC